LPAGISPFKFATQTKKEKILIQLQTKFTNTMKKGLIILTGILFMFSVAASSQTKTGFEYFKGKWNVTASSPYGDVKMVVGFERNDENVISTIKDSDGKELYKVVSTAVGEKQATVKFIGTQGEVTMVLNRKDDNALTGDIMDGMVPVSGERVK